LLIPPANIGKKFKLIAKIFALGGLFFFFFLLTLGIKNPTLPSEKTPIIFYSNQTGDDLKRVFLRSIQKTKKDLLLQIYGLTDPDIIKALKLTQARKKIFYDPSGSPLLRKNIPSAIPIHIRGLMHKKILIVDKKTVFIGTANLTPTSLCMHDNVVIGLESTELAHFLEHSLEAQFAFEIKNRKVEFWHLPDFQNRCIKRVLELINQAEKSIQVALFTFTHPKLLQALIDAKNRGVRVEVALDFYSARGSSKKAAALLKKENIPVLISQGGKLLHHKWALIDKKTLLVGSANWTTSAFAKNEDCILILEALEPKEKKHFKEIWKDIKWNCIKKR
jgi:cardiolipin synthase